VHGRQSWFGVSDSNAPRRPLLPANSADGSIFKLWEGSPDPDYGCLADVGMAPRNRGRRPLPQPINLGAFEGTSPALVGRWLVRFLAKWTDVSSRVRGAFWAHPGR